MSRSSQFARAFSIACTLVAGAVLFPASARAVVAPDFWPLVKCADRGVWGTVTEIQSRGEHRLLIISVTSNAFPENARGFSVLRLLERHGQLPEGTPLRSGASGLFLFKTAVDGGGEVPSVDGWFVPQGYMALNDLTLRRDIVNGLLSSQTPTEVRLDYSRRLLSTSSAEARKLALGWLRENRDQLTPSDYATMSHSFSEETDPVLQANYLELFLLSNQPLAGSGPARLVQREEPGELFELCVNYLERFAGVAERAELFQAYPGADPTRQKLLLEVYARLGMQEAWVWWEDALEFGQADVLATAVAFAGDGGFTGALDWYRALLSSDQVEYRKMALCGLAALATPEAILALQEYRNEAEADDPLADLAGRILKHPFRYGKAPRH